MSDETGTPVKKIDVTIARLRLLLADLTARDAALTGQLQTFREQRDKLITFSLYGDASLDTVVAMLADVEERTTQAETTQRALQAIRRRAEAELESLQLTKGIEEAKSLLSQLQARQAEAAESPGALSAEQIQAEIARLQALIQEASDRAAKSIEIRARRL